MEMTTNSKDVVEAQSLLWNQTFNYMTSMSLRCAVQLGIPDVISNHDGPVTIPHLVAELSIPTSKTDHLYRLMRVLVHTGIFALKKDNDGNEGYQLTTASRLLTKKNDANLSPMVILGTEPVVVTPGLSTAEWFHGTSSTPFDLVHGVSLYTYTSQHLDFSKIFNAGMGCDSVLVMKVLIEDLKPKFEGAKTLVDVGGGNGTVANAIAAALPNLKCSVYDLQHVIDDNKEKVKVTLIPGNMFEFVPSADIITIKNVLGDWGDVECLTILKRCREAISRQPGGGKVVIIDPVILDNKIDSEATLTKLINDISTITCLTGKERTENEWKEIFLEAGFTSYTMVPTLGANSIIEVFP